MDNFFQGYGYSIIVMAVPALVGVVNVHNFVLLVYTKSTDVVIVVLDRDHLATVDVVLDEFGNIVSLDVVVDVHAKIECREVMGKRGLFRGHFSSCDEAFVHLRWSQRVIGG